MPVKVFLTSCGILGSCAVIGVPVSVHEFNQQSSLWGEEWANASVFTSLSTLAGGGLDANARKQICKELGGDENSQTSQVSLRSSVDGDYGCKDGSQGSDLKEELDPKGYTGSLKHRKASNTSSSLIRCLRVEEGNNESNKNTKVDWSQCRKK